MAAHLAAAGMFLDDDPERAYVHAQAARRTAARVGAVREAVGVTAYRAGAFADAVTELRAARRISGRWDLLPLEADAERALGRPQRALALTRTVPPRALDPEVRIELAIVGSGARRDMGQARAAVALLAPLIDRDHPGDFGVRLWYAFAAALADAGRLDDARDWFSAVIALDEDIETDAADRLAALSEAPA